MIEIIPVAIAMLSSEVRRHFVPIRVQATIEQGLLILLCFMTETPDDRLMPRRADLRPISFFRRVQTETFLKADGILAFIPTCLLVAKESPAGMINQMGGDKRRMSQAEAVG